MKTWIKLLFVVLLLCRTGYAQGFVNLNFESAVIQTNLGTTFYVDPSKAIPGWTAYANTSALNTIGYNTISLGGAAVFIEDTNAPSGGGPLPIQGKYSVFLQGSTPAAAGTASIGQTGTIPISTLSLSFFARLGGTVLVSLDGQSLPFQAIGTGANYTIYEADVSSYAGQTGQLLFTAPVQNEALLDNIQFSTTPVPEPSAVALAALGGLLLAIFPSSRRPVGCQVKKTK